MNQLSESEAGFLSHMGRWGSDGYPCRKLKGAHWVWDEFYGIKGAPVVYKTRRECMAAIEAYVDTLIDRKAGRT